MTGHVGDRLPLAARVRAGETTVGTFVGLDSNVALDVVASTRLDWVLVDLEHGAGAEGAVRDAVPIAGYYGVEVITRVETGDRIRIGRVLDLGVAGVMVPRIGTVADVESAVSATRYPPHGLRGVARYNRAGEWGVQLSEEAPLTVIQIETVDALRGVDDIARTPGVDVLFVGPQDLAAALGVAEPRKSADFQAALDRVVATARAAGVAAGILAGDAKQAVEYGERGFTVLAVAGDTVLLKRSLGSELDLVRTGLSAQA